MDKYRRGRKGLWGRQNGNWALEQEDVEGKFLGGRQQMDCRKKGYDEDQVCEKGN